MLTQSRLKELMSYDPDTGLFTIVKRYGRSGQVGTIVATSQNAGYMTARIDGKSYLQHRLVWLYVHGCFPPDDMDHANGDRQDNRLANLRLATRAENLQNKSMQRNNTSGVVGVSWRANRSHWTAQIRAGSAYQYLGSFKTAGQASAAYLEAKSRLHEFQPVPRELMV